MKAKTLLLLAALTISTLSHAARIYVERSTGNGISPDELETTTTLVRTAVSEIGGHQIVDSPGTADFSLRPHLMRLGKAVLLSIEKVREGQVVFATQMKGQEIDELDKVALRVTRATIEEKAASHDPRVGEITDQEAKDGTERRPTRKLAYLGFGGAALGNLAASGTAFDVAGAINWDMNKIILQVLADFAIHGSAFFGTLGIGGHWVMLPGDFAPFLSADFGYGLTKVDRGLFGGATDAGFEAGFGGGLHFLHTFGTSLELGARLAWLLRTNNLGTPSLAELRLGLYF